MGKFLLIFVGIPLNFLPAAHMFATTDVVELKAASYIVFNLWIAVSLIITVRET